MQVKENAMMLLRKWRRVLSDDPELLKTLSVMMVTHKELYSVQFELIFQVALTKTHCIV